MTAVCPAGHTSSADDYCDVCGAPISPSPASPSPASRSPSSSAAAGGPTAGGGQAAAPGAAGGQPCPNCGTENAADALFCENCGFDFTTGSMPRAAEPATSDQPVDGAEASGHRAPADLAADGASGDEASADAAAGTGWVVEVWIDPAWYEAQQSPDPLPSPGPPDVVPLRGRSLLVGRTSASRNIHPDVRCEHDGGVSRRQAQLTSDGTRWWVEDLDSANGTFVAPSGGPLPDDPIPVGVRRELGPDDRIYVGAWTRLVLRPATEDEQG